MPCSVIFWERNIKGRCKYCCIPNSAEEREKILNQEKEIGKSEIFFDKTWSKCVGKMKYVIIVFSLVWAGISFFYASKFEAPDEEAPFLTKDNPTQMILVALTDNFPSSA